MIYPNPSLNRAFTLLSKFSLEPPIVSTTAPSAPPRTCPLLPPTHPRSLRRYKLNIWDVGGQKTLRSYWRNYFEATDGLVWVVRTAPPLASTHHPPFRRVPAIRPVILTVARRSRPPPSHPTAPRAVSAAVQRSSPRRPARTARPPPPPPARDPRPHTQVPADLAGSRPAGRDPGCHLPERGP